MYFSCDCIDIEGIVPSTLANSGLLMAELVVDGDEVASINMVCMYLIYRLRNLHLLLLREL